MVEGWMRETLWKNSKHASQEDEDEMETSGVDWTKDEPLQEVITGERWDPAIYWDDTASRV